MTFDAGQTLIELDTGLLAERLGERGTAVTVAGLDRALPAAYQALAVAAAAPGAGHDAGWKGLMTALLAGAGVAGTGPLVDWLWGEQPRRNLWRRPIAGMIELVDDLRRAGVAVGVISNSEGRLAELLAEIGLADRFACIADSGRLGLEKPDPRIFAWTLDRLGVPAGAAVHIGDSWPADIAGARAAGLRAIWFGTAATATPDQDVAACADAAAVRATLAGWGLHLA